MSSTIQLIYYVTCLALNRTLRNDIKSQIDEVRKANPTFNPKLSIIQVGAREDSSVYVSMKKKAAKEVISLTFVFSHAKKDFLTM